MNLRNRIQNLGVPEEYWRDHAKVNIDLTEPTEEELNGALRAIASYSVAHAAITEVYEALQIIRRRTNKDSHYKMVLSRYGPLIEQIYATSRQLHEQLETDVADSDQLE